MGSIVIFGRRVELLSMDPHFHDITLALYARPGGDGVPEYRIDTFSRRDGAADRVDFVAGTMRHLGGLAGPADDGRRLRFACDGDHTTACRRLFLEACKVDPAQALERRPLSVHDKKLDRAVVAENTDDGGYRLSADDGDEETARRLAIIAGGLVKLAGMETVGEAGDRVAFACGHDHDALVGLLLVRALNARAALRQEEQAGKRGVLAAPSAQTS